MPKVKYALIEQTQKNVYLHGTVVKTKYDEIFVLGKAKFKSK